MKRFARMLLPLLFLAAAAQAQLEITLKNSFIAEFRERAAITATYTVDKAHPRPNSGAKDGDIHVAGRSPEVGLATVAELMNAKDEQPAMDAIHAVEGTTTTIQVTGAWRLWAEHGGGDAQVQGKKLAKFTTTNPPHIFEIHPIVKVKGIDTRDSLHPIAGFTPKDAEQAFTSYENIRCTIKPGKTTTKLTTSMAGFNYVEFTMELLGDPVAIADGTKVFASVNTVDGDLLVHKRRMIFLKGTPPEVAVQSLHAGDELHVLGIPRISLALLSWRIDNAKQRPEVLTWNLPYEIIVVGIFP
jgi:hypothetical protein